jgi:hypothetical protein
LRLPAVGLENKLNEKAFMNKLVALALLVGGIVLIIIGFNATHSFASDVSRFFTGSPTDKAVWMLIGGSVAALVGLAMLWRSPKHA